MNRYIETMGRHGSYHPRGEYRANAPAAEPAPTEGGTLIYAGKRMEVAGDIVAALLAAATDGTDGLLTIDAGGKVTQLHIGVQGHSGDAPADQSQMAL